MSYIVKSQTHYLTHMGYCSSLPFARVFRTREDAQRAADAHNNHQYVLPIAESYCLFMRVEEA